MGSTSHHDMQAQLDDLLAQVTKLTARADDADVRADLNDARADQMDARADAMDRRADTSEARSAVDRELLTVLQADGVVHAAQLEQIAQLEKALTSARVIGAAIGILMESRGVTQDQAFALLREASSRTNRPLREIAAGIVEQR